MYNLYKFCTLEPPSAPGAPEPVDHDRDFIKIHWSPPAKDGGSSVTGYDVERRDTRLNRWVQINRELVKVSLKLLYVLLILKKVILFCFVNY